MMNKITKEHILNLMEQSKYQIYKAGEKTTIVCCMLPNKFEIIVSSGCVDAKNYDHDMGVRVCTRKLEGKLWELEVYLLQDKLFHAVESGEVEVANENS